MEDVIEYPPQIVPRPPGYLYLCLFLVSPNFLPNPHPHKPPRHLPPATPLWQPLVSLRPKSRPAEDHQRWQWQIYSSILHEIYFPNIYFHLTIFVDITRVWMDTTIWSRCLFIAQFRALRLGGRERCWFEKCWRSSALNCLPRLSLGC